MTSVTNTNTTTAIRLPDEGELALPKGRLIFALDATGSREPTWDIACTITAGMFRATALIGKLDVQLVYFGGGARGGHLEERSGGHCRASRWVQSGEELVRLMRLVKCESGYTQIGRVLDHALREHEKAAVQALTYIGDAMEEEIEVLAAKASRLGQAGIPIYIFQEGRDAAVRKAYRLLALKSGGEYFEFDAERGVEQLAEQLGAVARLAVGDTEALEQITGTAARQCCGLRGFFVGDRRPGICRRRGAGVRCENEAGRRLTASRICGLIDRGDGLASASSGIFYLLLKRRDCVGAAPIFLQGFGPAPAAFKIMVIALDVTALPICCSPPCACWAFSMASEIECAMV